MKSDKILAELKKWHLKEHKRLRNLQLKSKTKSQEWRKYKAAFQSVIHLNSLEKIKELEDKEVSDGK